MQKPLPQNVYGCRIVAPDRPAEKRSMLQNAVSAKQSPGKRKPARPRHRAGGVLQVICIVNFSQLLHSWGPGERIVQVLSARVIPIPREIAYAYGAVEPTTGDSFFLVLPYCNSDWMSAFLDELSRFCVLPCDTLMTPLCVI